MVKIKEIDIIYINSKFIYKINQNVLDLSLIIGDYFVKNLELNDFTIELYKFNETLTRLLNRTIDDSIDSNDSHDSNNHIKLDSNLILKSILLTLITKLEKLFELIRQVSLTNIQSKLIDDILEKNISQRILEPYHNLLILRIQNNMNQIY